MRKARIIKVGDTVLWSRNWGVEPEVEVKVLVIELCKKEGMKSGKRMLSVTENQLNRCVLDLSNGHWAYGYRIKIKE